MKHQENSMLNQNPTDMSSFIYLFHNSGYFTVALAGLLDIKSMFTRHSLTTDRIGTVTTNVENHTDLLRIKESKYLFIKDFVKRIKEAKEYEKKTPKKENYKPYERIVRFLKRNGYSAEKIWSLLVDHFSELLDPFYGPKTPPPLKTRHISRDDYT